MKPLIFNHLNFSKLGIMCGMKPIATDIYTFSNLIGGGYLYVDKTGILAKELDFT